MSVTDIFTMDAAKVHGLWKGMVTKLRKDNKKLFNYGAIVVLFIICVGLFVVLLREVQYQIGVRYLNTETNNIIGESTLQTGILTGSGQTIDGFIDNTQTDTELRAGNILSELLPEMQEKESYEFTVSDKAYFDDALFIGDSRTVGLKEFGTLDNASYFASSGLNLYTINGTTVKQLDEQGQEIEITLEQMLQNRTYGKIYLMLGINELGYDFDRTVEKYRKFVEYLFSMQPDTILYVCANLHVNSLRNEVDEIHNNKAINRINQEIAQLADQKNIFYLDVNPLFDDENGNLAEEYISDDSHVMGIYYETWCDWYCENTIVK